jgi:mannose-6-phosphate isomerase-like protein (cupin superfamily)
MSLYTWEEKCWGRTKRLWLSDLSHSTKHILEMKANTFCSYHFHRTRSNVFHVISGKVRVVCTRGVDIKQTVMSKNDTMTIPSQVSHQFQVIEDSLMVEDYHPDDPTQQPDPNDIERHWPGGTTSAEIIAVPHKLLITNGTLWLGRSVTGDPDEV